MEAFLVNSNSLTTTAALSLHWSDKSSADSLIRHIWDLLEAGRMSGRWQTGWQLWDDVCFPERTNAPLTELPLLFWSNFHHKWLQIWGEGKVTGRRINCKQPDKWTLCERDQAAQKFSKEVSRTTEGVDGGPQTSDPSNFNGRASSNLFIHAAAMVWRNNCIYLR